jgi:phosphoribosylformimino-5-aminoimidazole carboxamide ribonucleotide (ProFAR) isomerase
VANLNDVVQIKETKKIKGVIIGKAIYDKSINLEELAKI